MYNYRKFIHLLVFILFLIVLFSIKNENFLMRSNIDIQESIIDVSNIDDSIYKKIEGKSKALYEQPQDAYIDRVWKKTPGRNGIKINIKKSYKKMKDKQAFDESLLIYEQIRPKVSLSDLEASPIFRGHPEKNMVSLLINVSWGTEFIPDILTILKKHQVKATFFIEGKWAKENTNLVKMIDEQGHLIGNHAYNHPDMKHLTYEENKEQVTKTNEIIEAIIGERPKWFAPPSGSFTNDVIKLVEDLQMKTILWTVDTIDWKKPSVSVMINRVITKIHPGATILMHPTLSVANGLDEMIAEIKDKGYKIGTIETLLSEER